MKIAINATIVDPESSGLGVYTLNVTRELARLHSDITVYTSAPELFSCNGVTLELVTSNVRAARGFRGHVRRVLWSQFSLPRRLSASEASVLLSPTPLEGLMRTPIPQVMIVHDLLPIRYPESYRRQTHYFRYIVPILIRRSRRVIAVSNATKGDIVSYFHIKPELILVIPNGIDDSRFTFHSSGPGLIPENIREPYLLYVGNLFPHKNLDRLLVAFAGAASRIPHHLIIVGSKDPRYYPALQQKAGSLGIRERTTFLGYVSPELLPELYRHADWFILPSLFEGFGMTPLESMACGTPTLVSRTPALEETVADAGVYFNPTNIGDFSEKIVAACLDQSLRTRMRAKGFERVKHFSWGKAAREILNVLEEVDHSSFKSK